jgi:hypothetical protein
MFTVPAALPRPKTVELGPRLISTASRIRGSTGMRPLVSKLAKERLAGPTPRTRLAVFGLRELSTGLPFRSTENSVYVPVPSVPAS